ncbi:MAG TPA: MgtC/SapB family protein, partial [Atopobiaceae bacterium]|nr:MgtC/SapB family protein [Atopobiaceae bacterium]
MQIWEQFKFWISDLSFGSIIVRTLLAILVGVLLGSDRRDKNKGAGVRTHAMVCLGSAMTMIISQYFKVRFPEMAGDVFRLGAAVVSGIGFLGVGTIIVSDRNKIHGLTTAAGLWTCACIGLAAGAGFIEGTITAMLAAFFILHNLTALDR